MEYDELKDILKLDIPKPSKDFNKLLNACKRNQFNNNRFLLSFVLDSLVVVCILVLGIVLFSNKVPNNVIQINNSIENLRKVDNCEDKLMEIMRLRREINTISSTNQSKIALKELAYEETNTVKELKQSVDWKNYFKAESSYSTLEMIGDFSESKKYRVIGDVLRPLTTYERRINDSQFNADFISLIDVPFAEIVEELDGNRIVNTLRENTNVGETRAPYEVMTIVNNNIILEIMIFPCGYIVIRNMTIVDNRLAINNEYISLISVDYNEFYDLLSKENLANYNFDYGYEEQVELFTNDYLMTHTIDSLTFHLDAASSLLTIVNDENSINTFLSFFNIEKEMYAKELYYINSYEMSSINIGIVAKSEDGMIDKWSCSVSNEGILYIKPYESQYVYYTNKECVDYFGLLEYIKGCNK